MTNSEQVQEQIKALGLQSAGMSVDKISQPIPVVETNPRLLRVTNIVKAATGTATATIYTTPTNKEFYLTSAHYSFEKIVTDACAFANLTVVVEGVTVAILYFSGVTVTAERDQATITFPNPIKLDKGSAIIFGGNANFSGGRYGAVITGYTKEVNQ